jgi:glycerate kinase
MVNILIAPDKFKGSLSAMQVCQAIKETLYQKYTDIEITTVPLADGGEGTQELLNTIFNAFILTITVNDPLFSPVKASYGVSKDGAIAFIEMASASGLQLIEEKKRNPLYTSTFGTGELICDALDRGVSKVILGIGGSATNDAGIGMAAALGFKFVDAGGNLLKPTGENLIRIVNIDSSSVHSQLDKTEFITLCDVDNPLYGPHGAAFIYGPQKGADENNVQSLENGLRHFEAIVQKSFGKSANFPGAGAAGGLGAGSKIFLNATIKKGIEYMMEATALEEKIQRADLVITGEGKIDKQSLSGKVVMAVSLLAKGLKKTVIALCGKCELSPEELSKIGITQCISLVNEATPPEEAIKHASDLIKRRMEEQFVFENLRKS